MVLVIMVRTPVLEQAGIGKKRDSGEIEQDSNTNPSTTACSDMKKPRIAAGEALHEIIEGDRDYPPSPSASQSPGKGNIEETVLRFLPYSPKPRATIPCIRHSQRE